MAASSTSATTTRRSPATASPATASRASAWAAAPRSGSPQAAIRRGEERAVADPHPDDVRVTRNRVTGNGFGDAVELPGLPRQIPPVDLLWDRPLIVPLLETLAQQYPDLQPLVDYGTGNCWERNRFATNLPDPLPDCSPEG